MKRNPNVTPVNKLVNQSQSLKLKKKKINISSIRDTFKGKRIKKNLKSNNLKVTQKCMDQKL